ncbi:MAG: hypothetical protein J2P50_16640 [Hyphomicrobiaceae bacterium]|nr:hypothetical protein [Hyphomicrobiaceae bacterium]
MIIKRVGGLAAVISLCAALDVVWADPAQPTAANGSVAAGSNDTSSGARPRENITKPQNITKQRDGSLLIAGRSLRCGGTRNVLDPHLPNLGLAAPGVVVFNPRQLNRWPDTVRLFVFHHECGHHHVGGDELGADCWAVKQGVRQGWLGRDSLTQVCRSFGNGPATDSHPAGAARCASLNRCFATAMAALAKEKARGTTTEAKAEPPDTGAPKLLQGPTLKRSGMRPSFDVK